MPANGDITVASRFFSRPLFRWTHELWCYSMLESVHLQNFRLKHFWHQVWGNQDWCYSFVFNPTWKLPWCLNLLAWFKMNWQFFFSSHSPFWTAPLKRIFWITDVHAVLSYVHHTRKMTSSLPLVYMKRKPFFKISHEFLTIHNGDLMVHAKKWLNTCIAKARFRKVWISIRTKISSLWHIS